MPRKKEPKKKALPPATEAHPEPTLPESQFFPIAGFGASAGGLEAFSELLHRLPLDTGMGIVLIQHLDPKHASVLTELLARSTRMPVVQVTDGMQVQPNRVHVIPPNTNISISDKTFQVQARQTGAPFMPIDQFFRSLAEEQGTNSIGIVLSGTASDGTLGLKAIKAEGGMTFAQAPESAKFDGMPRSAIAAGCVDFVLSPLGIADELVQLCRHPYLNRRRPAEALPERDSAFREIFGMLRAATGVDFASYKPGTIRRRTIRRMAVQRLTAPEQYVKYLKTHREELDLLFQDLLINVTGFFRESATFEALRSKLLPDMFKDRPAEEAFRVWVPGCSTGEEAYSVAICLLEYIRETRIEVPIQVFGTDLSEAALQKARIGAYPESIASDIDAERLRRFFVRANGGYQIARQVRDLCVFARQNVTKDPPFSKLDLITCRNVLIYLGPVLQGRVMRLFHYALKPNGFLILGSSEHIGASGERFFDPVDKQHRIYSRKAIPAAITADFGAAYEEPAAAHRPPAVPGASESQTRVDRMLLARYSPPAVVVDRDLKVVQFRGDTVAFLGHPAGEATLDFMKLARGRLGSEVRRLIEKASKSTTPVKGEPIAVPFENELRNIRISVTPVHGLIPEEFLVVFDAVPPPKPERARAKAVPARAESGRLRDLEQELTETRQYLQSVIEEQEAATEELKSAHEELQSSNEELQSTNEELLTAKEELQSTNEELTTVNEELQNRNAELQQINNDLINLLSSVNIPIVMLDNELRIRRFAPQAEKFLSLIPADIGRPISDFRLKVIVPDLTALCRDVIDTLAPQEREVTDAEDHVYSMWVRPYRTADNHIEGVVLTLSDVTERKRAAEARYRRLFEAAKDGIVIADAGTGEIIDSNPLVGRLFGYARPRLVGHKFWESELFRDTEIDESTLLEVQERESIQKMLPLETDSGDHIEAEIIGSLYAEGDRKVIQFNIRDISLRRRMEERMRRNEEQMRQSQKLEAVGRLAGGVAHDFNNILTAITGYADLLRQELAADHPGRPMLREIRGSAERAVALTRQLLAFGRREVVNPAVLHPNTVISEMRQMLAVMLSEHVQLTMDLRPDVARIRADRTQVEQIVLNLVLNARDATADAGAITISTANVDVDENFSEQHPSVPVGRYLAISVRDTGAGMDEETRSHIFEPFFTTKPKGSGVGLGLSTVYNIVKQNGGYIWAYSELGVGSVFTVYLPRVEPEPERPAAAAPTREGKNGTETILLVEDDTTVRMLERRFLETLGYRILEASSGPDALRISRERAGPIHLMVTDVVMPRMSGRELAFQLAPERPDMKVLYTSGHAEDTISFHGVLKQGLAFMQKPFSREALVSRVRQLLDGGGAGADAADPEGPEGET